MNKGVCLGCGLSQYGCFTPDKAGWYCCGCDSFGRCGVCRTSLDCTVNLFTCRGTQPSSDAGTVITIIFVSVVIIVIVCVVVAAICRNRGYYSTYSTPTVTYHTSTYSSGIGYSGGGGSTYSSGIGYSSGGGGGGGGGGSTYSAGMGYAT